MQSGSRTSRALRDAAWTAIPPIEPETTEYRVPASPFGSRLMSLIALFTGVYHRSWRQTAAVLHYVLGVRLSVGALRSLWTIATTVATVFKSAINGSAERVKPHGLTPRVTGVATEWRRALRARRRRLRVAPSRRTIGGAVARQQIPRGYGLSSLPTWRLPLAEEPRRR